MDVSIASENLEGPFCSLFSTQAWEEWVSWEQAVEIEVAEAKNIVMNLTNASDARFCNLAV